jgi:Bifunctional DNA primase/polymerase, N-terminal/Protein of unknown function (DUF3987)
MFETDPKGAGGGLNRILEAALAYLRRGWRPIPLEGKRPRGEAWQKAEYDETELIGLFADGDNVGVVLGEASGLVDIDLDCSEARSLAADLLPKTSARFGRKSSPLSHWLYTVVGPVKTQRFADPEETGDAAAERKGAIVEFRGARAQTMVPPSTHPSGEAVEWETESAVPATIKLEELRGSVLKLAAGVLVVRRWRKVPRHDTILALAGALLQGGLSIEVTTHFLLAVVGAAGDDEPDDRARAIEDSIKRYSAGEPVAGAAKCREIFGDKTWSTFSGWLGLRNAGEWETLDASIVNGCRHAAPELPLDGLGDRWASWVAEQAALKSAPRDYVFAPLLVAAAGLIGNSRAASPWDGWEEPSILWGAKLGDPSSGKSPAADPVHSILHALEREREAAVLKSIALVTRTPQFSSSVCQLASTAVFSQTA